MHPADTEHEPRETREGGGSLSSRSSSTRQQVPKLGRWKKDLDRLLASIYGRFIEGFDTPDMREAKTLLDELR